MILHPRAKFCHVTDLSMAKYIDHLLGEYIKQEKFIFIITIVGLYRQLNLFNEPTGPIIFLCTDAS